MPAVQSVSSPDLPQEHMAASRQPILKSAAAGLRRWPSGTLSCLHCSHCAGVARGRPEFHFSRHIDNSRLVKAADPVRVREMRLFSAAMTVLFSLVMIYGLQHFYAIEGGYRWSLRSRCVDQLREENRQLRLAEAQLTQPGRIDQMARQMGLAEPQPGQVIHPNAPSRRPPVLPSHAPRPNCLQVSSTVRANASLYR